MTTLVLITRLVLAAVFAVAGLAKLADRGGTREAVVAFGAPERTAGSIALALPLVEIAVAGILLPASTAVYGVLGAVALLGLFTAVIGIGLARGKTPDCHCFGQLHSAPASWKTLARNGLLLAVGVLVLAGSLAVETTSAVAWIGALRSELLALVLGVGLAAVLVIGGAAFVSLMRSYGRVLTRLDRVEAALASAGLDLEEELELPEIGLEPGTPAPSFMARSVDGHNVSLESLTASGLPTLMVFTSPRCGPCAALMPTIAEWQREQAETLSIVLASSGTPDEVRADADEHRLEKVILDVNNELYELFQANGTPSALLIGADGQISSWVASGREWIEHLVGQASSSDRDEGLPIGAEAPPLELPSLAGETVSLESLRGRDTLLLFWNPSCGFCRAMHEELLAWDASANGIHPRLVVVSSGDAVGTRAEGFASLVLLDDSYVAGSAFGANGTPMAVLLDGEGRVASRVVAGADAVLELAGVALPA